MPLHPATTTHLADTDAERDADIECDAHTERDTHTEPDVLHRARLHDADSLIRHRRTYRRWLR